MKITERHSYGNKEIIICLDFQNNVKEVGDKIKKKRSENSNYRQVAELIDGRLWERSQTKVRVNQERTLNCNCSRKAMGAVVPLSPVLFPVVVITLPCIGFCLVCEVKIREKTLVHF